MSECQHEWSENSLGELTCDHCGLLYRPAVPRGGMERNWWKEYQLIRRQFKKLEKAAREVLAETDRVLAEDAAPIKFRAPYGALTKLREALPETYAEFKASKEPPHVER